MHLLRSFLISLAAAKAFAATSTTGAAASSITGCHTHGSETYCFNSDGHEVLVSASATPTKGTPAQYTGCHSHGNESYCMDQDGNDVLVQEQGTEEEESEDHNHSHEESEQSEASESEEGANCHFHAGVEHCVSAGESEESSHQSCGIQTRDYNVPLRIGTLFVILITSAAGVFAPLLLSKLPYTPVNCVVSTIIKQFGTGIIIATAFIHLYTHASLMFTNECLGELDYEATTSAVVIAGIFLAFLFEYVGHRVLTARATEAPTSSAEPSSSPEPSRKEDVPSHQQSTLAHIGHTHGDPTRPTTKFSVLVMEAGVLFHSILIGLTLVVAGDSFYKTLLVVIVFHQFFEGLALGARIATLPGAIFPSKAIMAAAFALITPIGMAIGLGVLHSFNGNEKSTLIALGTLDALSAGILVWVGVVDMWARDWVIEGGEMLDAPLPRVLTGGLSLVTGLALMGLLGKWA